MREAFKPGTIVRWDIPDGGLCKIVGYDLEGYYIVRTIPDGRLLQGYKVDLLLLEEWKKKYGRK